MLKLWNRCDLRAHDDDDDDDYATIILRFRALIKNRHWNEEWKCQRLSVRFPSNEKERPEIVASFTLCAITARVTQNQWEKCQFFHCKRSMVLRCEMRNKKFSPIPFAFFGAWFAFMLAHSPHYVFQIFFSRFRSFFLDAGNVSLLLRWFSAFIELKFISDCIRDSAQTTD